MNEYILENILSFLLLEDDCFYFLGPDYSLEDVDRWWQEVRQLACINHQALRLVRRSSRGNVAWSYTCCFEKWTVDAPGQLAWELPEYGRFCEMGYLICKLGGYAKFRAVVFEVESLFIETRHERWLYRVIGPQGLGLVRDVLEQCPRNGLPPRQRRYISSLLSS